MDDITKDMIPRKAVEYCLRKETVSTNPEAYKAHKKFIGYMDDPEISQFGHWMHANGYNCALTSVAVDLEKIPSALPSATDTNVGGNLIDRQAALNALGERPSVWTDDDDYALGERNQYDMDRLAIETVPSAQPNLSEAYSKAVFTWLMDYQIRAAELKGRYTPYEVLSWVINDWRKENE